MTEKKIPRSNISAYVKKYLQLCIGAVIAALGLELFLIPNEVIDGGVVGLSIMAQYVTGLPLGTFLSRLISRSCGWLTSKSAKISSSLRLWR